MVIDGDIVPVDPQLLFQRLHITVRWKKKGATFDTDFQQLCAVCFEAFWEEIRNCIRWLPKLTLLLKTPHICEESQVTLDDLLYYSSHDVKHVGRIVPICS